MATRVALVRDADASAPSQPIAVLSRLVGIAADELTITHHCEVCGGSDHGRPLLRIGGLISDRAISLSRTAGWLALAVTDDHAPAPRIGVDIETIATVSQYELNSVAFTPAELDALDEFEGLARADAATHIWTAKEAVTKSFGVGLLDDLAGYECSQVSPGLDSCEVLHEARTRIAATATAAVPVTKVHFDHPGQGIVAALATSGDEPVVWLSWERS